jgi:hypothetical protein
MTLRDKITKEPVSTPFSTDYKTIGDFFKRSILTWEESEAYKQLKSTLISANAACEIQKVVGLACGPISLGEQYFLAHRSAFQHALLLTVRDLLQDKDKKVKDGIACYAQDPAYTSIDKSVLEECGIRVLDDPGAFLEIDDSSVVFSCAADLPVKQIVIDLARPAILIWDRVTEEEEGDLYMGILR